MYKVRRLSDQSVFAAKVIRVQPSRIGHISQRVTERSHLLLPKGGIVDA